MMNSYSKINKSSEGMKHVYYSNGENDAKVRRQKAQHWYKFF